MFKVKLKQIFKQLFVSLMSQVMAFLIWIVFFRVRERHVSTMDLRMNDSDIRKILHTNIEVWFESDPSTLVVDELTVCNGGARADVSVINGHLYGYEIKSDIDTLVRLPNQIDHYNKVFDYVSLVCSPKFVTQARSLIPRWWGLYSISTVGGNSTLKKVRTPKPNKKLDNFALAQFLLKDELVTYLLKNGYPKNIARSPKYILWEEIAKTTSTQHLSEYVRLCLKARKDNSLA